MKRNYNNIKAKLMLKPVTKQLTKRTVQKFAEQIGLVYFGYVNQRSDEHRLVRGLTVSNSHVDNHYCIGTFDGYDITMVKRSDTIRHPHKAPKQYSLMIMTFDLHRSVDLPHTFLGLRSYSHDFYSHLFTKFVHFSAVDVRREAGYKDDFLRRYGLYSTPAQVMSAQWLFTPQIANFIAENFPKFSYEISQGCLYVYVDDHQPSQATLERMLKSGLWLSRVLDESN